MTCPFRRTLFVRTVARHVVTAYAFLTMAGEGAVHPKGTTVTSLKKPHIDHSTIS
ncbi:hypothetical protein DPMN_100505 [Dreissena polymorpha]|uniref:Uncharacterized protein n=1 Tax=Dreissena polymorpha TaxID=45954 RepID=A0A9D4LHJ4_DREPO|nr:hypothetical protein DPMN_100505 [Dreissena polymorpha]